MTARRKMPRYSTQKEVRALKIHHVDRGECGAGVIIPADPKFSAINVSAEYMQEQKPQTAGYYVVDAEGKESYVPAKTFEGDYTPL